MSNTDTTLRIVFFGNMPSKGYSGGRYHAWVMGEALLHMGNDVYIITNAIPEFDNDFLFYPNHSKRHIILVDDYMKVIFPEIEVDYVIFIPGVAADVYLYAACLKFTFEKRAKLAFVNFETPNWFMRYGIDDRPMFGYELLRKMCQYGTLVLSISNESQKEAEKYYDLYPDSTEFMVWHPAINSLLADSISEEKTNQVMVFLRSKDRHKGGNDFLGLLGEYLRGYKCLCIVGSGMLDEALKDLIVDKCQNSGIEISFKRAISDREKFRELKRSRLLLYPSHFEGYGYPPVEALYCGTRCVAYELPVIKEVCGNYVSYGKVGDIKNMRQIAEHLLNTDKIESVCVDTASFEKQAKRIDHILRMSAESSKMALNDERFLKAVSDVTELYKQCNEWSDYIPATSMNCLLNGIKVSQILKDKDETWEVVEKESEGKEVYIWGAGLMYQQFYKVVSNHLRINGLIDASPVLIGTKDKVSNTFIIDSPDFLNTRDPASTLVIIAIQNNVDDIIRELHKRNFFYVHSLCMIGMNDERAKKAKDYWERYIEVKYV